MVLETFGMWSFSAITLFLAIIMFLCIISINLIVDYRKNAEILKRDIYKRYQKDYPKLKSDFTIDELKLYDGMHEETNYRILTAVDGLIFDVTRRWDLYGPGKLLFDLDRPYCQFSGKDASRSLVHFQTNLATDKYDNLLDLSVKEVDNLEEWKRQFCDSYPLVGRLLKPGQEDEKYEYDENDEIPVVYKTDY